MSTQGIVSSSSSSPRSTAPFNSYSDYTKYVKEQEAAAAAATYEWDKELWLGQLETGSKSVQWYRFSSKPETQSPQWEDHGTNNIPYKSTGSRELFQDQLKKSKQTVCWQILFGLINCGEPPAHFDDEWYANPMEWFADLTGLALNMPLVVWHHISDRLAHVKSTRYDGIGFKSESPVLDIGFHSMMVLNTTDDELPPTIVNLLPLNKGQDIFDPAIRLRGFPALIRQPQWMLSKFNTPQNAATTQDYVQNEAPESAMIRGRVDQICSSRTRLPSLTDAIFACLTVLLQFHLDRPSTYIPYLEDPFNDNERIRLKYYRWSRNTGSLDAQRARVSIRELWSLLRNELNVQQIFSKRISTFIQEYLSNLPQGEASTLRGLVERLRLRVLELEQSELTLKDRISMYSSAKSTEMAERSIHESKRVILLTALAFFFLPISLTSSIYGMNIQQINNTGHSIQAFVITSIAMCTAAVMLWFTIAQLASKRERLKKEVSQSYQWPTSWPKRLLLWNPMGSLRLWWNFDLPRLKRKAVASFKLFVHGSDGSRRQQTETSSYLEGQA